MAELSSRPKYILPISESILRLYVRVSLDVEVGLPRVQGHPVTDPQSESNGKRDPHRDFHFAESIRFARIGEGIINLLDKPGG